MEDHALDVLPDKGEPQFDIVKEQRISAQREARRLRSRTAGDQRRSHISRSGLVVGKRPQGIRASAEESLRQGNGLLLTDARRCCKRREHSELDLPGQSDGARHPMVCGIAEKYPPEAALRTKKFGRKPDVSRVVHTSVGIAGIVPSILS